MHRTLARRLFAELLGSALLAAVVVGSGIAAQQLSPGSIGLELFENAAARAVGLYAIILMFGPVAGGDFNGGGVAIVAIRALDARITRSRPPTPFFLTEHLPRPTNAVIEPPADALMSPRNELGPA